MLLIQKNISSLVFWQKKHSFHIHKYYSKIFLWLFNHNALCIQNMIRSSTPLVWYNSTVTVNPHGDLIFVNNQCMNVLLCWQILSKKNICFPNFFYTGDIFRICSNQTSIRNILKLNWNITVTCPFTNAFTFSSSSPSRRSKK
jgi:hypothetical protein